MANKYASLQNFSVKTKEGPEGNQALLMPKIKFRFRVIFLGLATSDALDENARIELTRQVVSVTRPSVEFDTDVIEVYNSRINYIGKPKWSDITLTVRDDVKGVTSTIVAELVQRQFDFYEQSMATSAGDYKFDMHIEMTDGGNGSGDTGAGIQILERWTCLGCLLQKAEYGDLSYSETKAVEIKLNIKMDNCIQEIGGPGNALAQDITSETADVPGVGSPTTSTRIGADATSWLMTYTGSTQE